MGLPFLVQVPQQVPLYYEGQSTYQAGHLDSKKGGRGGGKGRWEVSIMVTESTAVVGERVSPPYLFITKMVITVHLPLITILNGKDEQF